MLVKEKKKEAKKKRKVIVVIIVIVVLYILVTHNICPTIGVHHIDQSKLKAVPDIILDIINGDHIKYIQPKIERILTRFPSPDGMRMLVYCADQAIYHDQNVVKQLYSIYPYLDGYHINDVWKPVCDCWNNTPVKAETKKHFYTNTPVLIADGAMDPGCSPRYMLELKHYMVNAQAFLLTNMSHGVGGKTFSLMMQQFLDNKPYLTINPKDESVVFLER